jgi:transmembrane sensor
MTDPERDPPIEDQLLQEAATWFARMRGPDAEASEPDFEAWLGRGALHRRAYNRASEIFAMGKLLADGSEAPATTQEVPRRESARRTAVLAAVAFLVLVSAAWLLHTVSRFKGQEIASGDSTDKPSTLRFATGVDQIRSVRLEDGSIVKLDADTRLVILFDRRLRRLALEQGLARFQVAHEARPFVVHAGGGSVTARGTIFDVALTKDRRVSVSLIQGIVDVSLPSSEHADKPRPATRRLRSGETLSFAAARRVDDRAPGSGKSAAGSATDTARDYDNVRLADLIAEANHGSSRQIVLATPAIGDRRVSGRFRIDDPQLLAQRLAALFDFTVEGRAADILLSVR